MVYKEKISIKMKTMKNMKVYLVSLMVLLAMGNLAVAQPGKTKTGPCDPALKYGKDSVTTIKNISMFNQYYKAKDYANCYPYWVYLYENVPCYQKIITYNGPLIIKYYMKALRKTNKEEYDSRKVGLIDTVLMVYDTRIELWGQEGYVKGKKAADMALLKPAERQAALELFEESVELDGNKSYYKSLIYYMQTAVKEHIDSAYTLDSLYNLYFQLSGIVNHNLKKPGLKEKKRKQYEMADTTIEKMIKPFLKCDVIESYFGPQIEANPEDVVLLKRAISLLDNAKCDGEAFYLTLAEKLYPIEPSSESAMAIARAYHAKQDYTKAIDYYVKSTEGIEDNAEKSDVLGTIANLYNKQGNSSQAVKYAKDALALNGENGKAHLLIAGSWAKMASSCGSDNLDGKSVYWAAYDKAARAKAADPSLEEAATRLMNQCAGGWPTKEDAFFKGFTNAQGSSYTVPCLGVSTTVRYKQ
jgi:tetratricopeptide (TPR) repeat protein